MTPIKRRKRQKLVYCISALKNFMSSLLCHHLLTYQELVTTCEAARCFTYKRIRTPNACQSVSSHLKWP